MPAPRTTALRNWLAAPLIILASLALVGCGAGSITPSASPASPAASAPWSLSDLPTIGTPADNGARIVKEETLSERMRDLTIESPSVGTVQVRLLLPASFESDPAATFPALYLLHGADGEYSDWTEKSDVEGTTGPTDLLVVMPAAASSFAGESNTQGSGPAGRAAWMPFHATELTQLMERNWRAGDVRALAGLSLGGYGAIALAAKNPGLYQAVASYSGALDMKGLIEGYLENADPETVAQIEEIISEGRELVDMTLAEMAPLLRGTKVVFVSYGNGEPGPLDPPDRIAGSPLEKWCGGGSDLFVEELRKAGVPVTVDDYGDGTHSWEYWDRELQLSLPLMLEAVGLPVPAELASPGA